MHGTPAGLPWGMPGIGELIEGAMQHAPQFGRQSMEFPNHGFPGLARIIPGSRLLSGLVPR